jgi:uncharacterized RDD family membrane protein YckC
MNTPTPNQQNPYAPPKAAVRDVPDADSAGEHASRLTRLIAVILDGLIMALFIYTPLLMGGVLKARGGKIDASSFLGVGSLIAVIGLIVWIVLTVRFVSANGQSIGKRLLGIKVVRADGSHATLGRIFWLRNVVNGVPGLIPLVGGIYGLVDCLLIFGEPRQCLHDKIADTIVIKA